MHEDTEHIPVPLEHRPVVEAFQVNGKTAIIEEGNNDAHILGHTVEVEQ